MALAMSAGRERRISGKLDGWIGHVDEASKWFTVENLGAGFCESICRLHDVGSYISGETDRSEIRIQTLLSPEVGHGSTP